MDTLSQVSQICVCPLGLMFPNVIPLTEHKTLLLQTFLLVLAACSSSGQILSVRTEVKKVLDTSSFFMSLVTKFPASFSVRPLFSQISAVLLMRLQKKSLSCLLSVSLKIQMQMGFSLHNTLPAQSESYSSFHLLCKSFLGLNQELLLTHLCRPPAAMA